MLALEWACKFWLKNCKIRFFSPGIPWAFFMLTLEGGGYKPANRSCLSKAGEQLFRSIRRLADYRTNGREQLTGHRSPVQMGKKLRRTMSCSLFAVGVRRLADGTKRAER